jgi:hypothetical protein
MGRWPWNAVLVIALAIALTGCISDQKRDLAGCLSAKSKQVCMAQKSYDPDFHNTHCSPLATPANDPYCYRPRGWFAKMGVSIEAFFAPAPAAPAG